jgi:hypothetical protein
MVDPDNDHHDDAARTLNPLILTDADIKLICAALSDASNTALHMAGELLDRGEEAKALLYYRESREQHKLHKMLFCVIHGGPHRP